jgi:hypothetical protein
MLSEEYVVRLSKEETNYLWRLGYRKVEAPKDED